MERGVISYDDRSGKLVQGKVWQLDYASEALLAEGFVRAEVSEEKKEEIKNCPADKRHVTGYKVLEVLLDLFGGPAVGDFVFAWGCPIISEQFARRLNGSKLTGYEIRPIVKVVFNQSRARAPKLLYLEFRGKGGITSHRYQIKGAPNLCPHCKKVPMLCPSCGELNTPQCVHCGQWTLFNPEAPEYSHPNGFRYGAGIPRELVIVEGQQWDGSDFFRADGRACVSNRAKEWLEQTHTFPVAFQPALLNIEGVEEKFKGK